MLEWLKEILGEAYTEDIDRKVSEQIGRDFVSRGDFNKKNNDLQTANATIATLQDAARRFEGVDVEGLQRQIATLQGKYDTDVAALRRDSAIDLALTGGRVRNVKAARSMLDLDKVSYADGKLSGLDEQLTALRTSDGWLFDSGEVGSTGGDHGSGGSSGDMDGVESAFRALNPTLKL